MYTLPENFNANAVRNEKITQISFGLNFITLHFDNGFIQLYGDFSYKYMGGIHVINELFPVTNDFGLLFLLDKTIIEVVLNQQNDGFTIIFDNSSELALKGNEMFESFLLNINGQEILI